MADKGLKKSLYTSARLKKGEVIYLETHYNRYELLPLTIWPSPEVIFLTSVEHSSFISPPPVTASFHRYELCFSGEKARLVGSSSNAADAETEKHQNSSHHHSQNGDRASSEHELRDLFRWSRCKKAMPESSMRSIGIPLPADQLEVTSCFLTLKWWIIRDTETTILTWFSCYLDATQVLQDNLEWEDVQWSQTGVWVAGKEYPLARVHFLSSN